MKGSGPQTAPPLRCQSESSRSPKLPRLLSDFATNQRFSWPPPLRFDYLLEQFPELRKDLFTFIISLKDMVKATDEQSDKEIQRASNGRIQSTGATAPVQLASIVLQLYGCVHQPGSSPNPAFLWRLHHIGMIDHYLHFQPLSPWWGWIPSFQSRFGLSDDQLSSRSPPRITSFIQKTLLSPRKFLEI